MTIKGEWDESLIWCPSQCELPVEHDGQEFVLYLRWRHQDPWSGQMFRKGRTYPMSECLFARYHEQYSADELRKAETALIRLAARFAEDGGLSEWLEACAEADAQREESKDDS